MKESSGVFVSMSPRWDFKVHEVVGSSFRQANWFFSCISDQNQKRSIQEVSLIAQGAINEFQNLLTLLDGSMQPDCKRIRKGPLPNSRDINPAELMEAPNSVSQSNLTGADMVRQLFPLQGIQSNASLIPTSSLNLYGEKQKSKADVDVTNNLILGLNRSLLAFLSLDGRGINKQAFHCSSMGSFPDDSSMVSKSTSGVTREEAGTKCLASTGGCHCSERRKLRAKKIIQVAALGSKEADIPPDDHTWRKYGQKPIKGSPHPRSYYKCSSMRGCPARKHMERSLEDPTMLVVTYQGDHNHCTQPDDSSLTRKFKHYTHFITSSP